MQVHIFRGPGRVFAVTTDPAGGNLPTLYAPWTAFKTMDLQKGVHTPGLDVDECLKDLEVHGVHVTDAHNRITEQALSLGKCHAVLVIGAGPTGLMLAGELALAGVDVAVVERRPDQTLAGSRAGGLHSRTIEVLDQRGIAQRFLAEGQTTQRLAFCSTRLDISDLPTRHPYVLGLWQNHIERLLAGWIDELGVRIYRGQELTGFLQNDAGVEIVLASGSRLRAQYVVGCDGGRSLVRKTAGIGFPGWAATTSRLMAEVKMSEAPPLGIHRTALGIHSFGRLEYEIQNGEVVFKDVGPIKVMVTEQQVGQTAEPTLSDLRKALIAACGTDYGLQSVQRISRFTDSTRQAAVYRDRRVLLAGDAAHVHSPVGGQGLNMGVQDAVNLGWKLAQVVKQQSPESLLDTYHAERHPVGERVLRSTMAQAPLLHADDRTDALREVLAELLSMDEPRKRFGAMQAGLDIHYDLGEGHALLGRRMPDIDLDIASRCLRAYELLHRARPVLLNFGEPGSIEIDPWHEHVDLFDCVYRGTWQLPSVGEVKAPAAVLIRPDGYVAWVGEGDTRGLADAITRWFGAAH